MSNRLTFFYSLNIVGVMCPHPTVEEYLGSTGQQTRSVLTAVDTNLLSPQRVSNLGYTGIVRLQPHTIP